MPSPRFHLAALLAAVVPLAAAAPASADTVVAGTQIVQGNQCLGPTCIDGEPFAARPLRLKTTDTPAVSLVQTAGGGFTAQTWDVAGNEANFFIRDLTGGSRLPFRIRPGAPTSSIEISATGDVSTAAMLQQDVGAIDVTGPVDGAAVLAALRGLAISRYRIDADTASAPHVGPDGAAFRAAFATGNSDTKLAAADMAGIALAAVRALDARVSTLALTPGPQGAAGAAGQAGAAGPAGATGAKGDNAGAALRAATARVAKLEKANKKLTNGLASLRRQVKALAARR